MATVPDYPSNSSLAMGTPNKKGPPEPPASVESVVDSKAKVKTRSGKGLRGFLLAQDFRDIKDGVIDDIIRPKIKDIVYNIAESIGNTIDSSIQMMIFGDVKRSPSNRIGDRVSYNQYSNRKAAPAPTMSAAYSCDDLSYETRGDAEAVLTSMREHLNQYPFVTVAQMYEFSGLTMQNYTANNYGWTDLSGVSVKRSFDGDYIIDLPRARPIVK